MGGPPKPPAKRRGRALPGWLPVALIALLIIGGVFLIAIGFFTDAGEQNTAIEPSQTSTDANPPVQKQKQKAGSQTQQQAKPTTPAAAPPTAAAGIDRRTFADRFELGVPSGWRSGQRDGGTVLTAPGGKAEVEVLFGSQRPPQQLADQAAQLLGQRHSGARVGRAQPTRIGGQSALRVDAEYAGGKASAFVLNQGSFSFLLIEQVDAGAPAAISGQARAVVESFRAL